MSHSNNPIPLAPLQASHRADTGSGLFETWLRQDMVRRHSGILTEELPASFLELIAESERG